MSHRVLFLLPLLFLSACCACPNGSSKIATQLPEPITPSDQINRLTQWSRQFPRLRATIVTAGVRLDYRDDNNQPKSVNAEGMLQIQQHLNETAATGVFETGADVLLTGTSFDQPAFEAGRNSKDWWFAIKLDTKKAWLGDASAGPDLSHLAEKGSATILRADLVPDLLGLSRLPENVSDNVHGAVFASKVMMLVDDADGANHVLIADPNGGVYPFIAREILVDRRTGYISEVRLYNASGILAVRSQLSDYKPVTYAAGVTPASPAPRFPHKVVVSYPTQFLTVSLEFDQVQLRASFAPVVFATPDFRAQGLRIMTDQ